MAPYVLQEAPRLYEEVLLVEVGAPSTFFDREEEVARMALVKSR